MYHVPISSMHAYAHRVWSSIFRDRIIGEISLLLSACASTGVWWRVINSVSASPRKGMKRRYRHRLGTSLSMMEAFWRCLERKWRNNRKPKPLRIKRQLLPVKAEQSVEQIQVLNKRRDRERGPMLNLIRFCYLLDVTVTCPSSLVPRQHGRREKCLTPNLITHHLQYSQCLRPSLVTRVGHHLTITKPCYSRGPSLDSIATQRRLKAGKW